MKIKHLKLENFTCFENFATNFDDRLTVFVGSNGSGKTSILKALTLLSEFFRDGFKNHQIHDHGNLQRNKSVNREGYILLNSNITVGNRVIEVSNNIEIQKKQKYDFIAADDRKIYSIFSQFSAQHGKVPFVYYTSKRVLPDDTSISTKYKEISKDSAFENNTQPQIDFASTGTWFYQRDSDEGRYIRDFKDLNYRIPELEAVREAVSLALGDYKSPRIVGSPPELVVYKEDDEKYEHPFTVNQLSDGYRTMLALIMDLARRMAVANGELYAEQNKPVLESYAVVLIDEVELHLHPSWQQKVLPSLLKIFRNTQFIVTTHSPQVISSIANEHIRLLDNGNVYSITEVTEGVDSARILEEIFDVNPFPKDNDWTKNLIKCKELIFGDEWDSEEASLLLSTLEEHYGKDYPDLYEMRLHRENLQWERDHEEG